ncbi:MAG: YciI family protein [Sphingobium sp.]
MFFIILAADRPGMLDKRQEHRQRHLDYWLSHGDAIKVAGAMLNGDGPNAMPAGSSFLIEVADESAARALIAADPFMLEGIFQDDCTVQPVRPAIGVWRPK